MGTSISSSATAHTIAVEDRLDTSAAIVKSSSDSCRYDYLFNQNMLTLEWQR